VEVAAAKQVTSGNHVVEAMHVTPDGKWLVYDSDVLGNAEIFRIPIEGGEPTRLTIEPAGDFGPAVSPDGRSLAYFSWRTKSRDVFVQPFDGGPPTQVTATDGQECYPRWMPDGSLLFLDQTVENGLLRGIFVTRRGADGVWSTPERLLPPGTLSAVVTQDGRLVYTRNGVVEMVRPGQPAPVVLYRPVGPDMPRPTFLAIDETRGRYFTKAIDQTGRASFWSFPLSGGPPTLIVRFDDLARQSPRLDFAVGAGRLFFTIEERRSNIWIAGVTER
jgi:tricorn protease-like protein